MLEMWYLFLSYKLNTSYCMKLGAVTSLLFS